jgi:hypothetical protein
VRSTSRQADIGRQSLCRIRLEAEASLIGSLVRMARSNQQANEGASRATWLQKWCGILGFLERIHSNILGLGMLIGHITCGGNLL